MTASRKSDRSTRRLFRNPSGQDEMFEKSYEEELERQSKQSVECLGVTFANDAELRRYFLEKLKEKLRDPEFRKIEGFPIASDEDILRLSDPPFYTACPNPFIEEFVRRYGKEYDSNQTYSREPFASDVSEGKSDAIYNAHSYHTKVPHKAIMRYILHYTEPGDIVFDAFCGTGMTGIAAQLCGDRNAVESLGYSVESDGQVRESSVDGAQNASPREVSSLGHRRAVLIDLSPAATVVACNYNLPVDIGRFQQNAQRILAEVQDQCGWMYETLHTDHKTKGTINYTVWSEVLLCSECSRELVFMDAAIDHKTGGVVEEFPCPHCDALLNKAKLVPSYESRQDTALNQVVRSPKRVPRLINYSVGKKRFEKKPDEADLRALRKISDLRLPPNMPLTPLPDMQMMRVGRMQPSAITHIHHFYMARTAQILASLWQKANDVKDVRLRLLLEFWLDSHFVNLSVRNRYRPDVSFPYNPLTGVFYIPQMVSEPSVFTAYANKLDRIVKAFAGYKPTRGVSLIGTSSATKVQLPSSSVDYIFTDPPFGENIYYSDLNFFVEAWYRVFTNTDPEAIVDNVKRKELIDYQLLMQKCFGEYFRVLKPGRWMTVEFHNSRNSVWNAIQEALQGAGFVVADVRTLDKQQGSFQQVTSANAVKQDLIISAYKPNGGLEQRFELEKGSAEGAWDFVRTHLRKLPIFVAKAGKVEIAGERQAYLLYDRMVAFHVQRGVTVPLSLAEFQAGLSERFPERDGTYFLSEQISEYDQKRLISKEVKQLEIFVRNESSAILWLRQQLMNAPQTFQDLHPKFLKEVAGWDKHERALELRELLDQNFLCYDAETEVPSQIHSYLSSNFHEFRKLTKESHALKQKAKDRYYVPDPSKEIDVQKTRERALLREFDEYREAKQKKLKVFRVEAVRAGFRRAWQQNDYQTILALSEKIPEDVLQEDSMLLMWYTNSLTRAGRQQ
jgi:DNA modification methylase